MQPTTASAPRVMTTGVILVALLNAAPRASAETESDNVVASRPTEDRPGAGRTRFVVASTAASFYGGIALAEIAGPEEGPAAGLWLVGATGAGLGLSLGASSRLSPTKAAADGYTFGLVAGGLNSLLVSGALDLRGDSGLGVGLVGIATGGYLGYGLARAGDATGGQVRVSATAALYGLATAGLGLGLTEPSAGSTTGALTLLGGLNAGAITGMALSRDLDWSTRRANLVLLSAGLGALGGVAAGAAAGATERDVPEKRAIRLLSGGILGGMWAGIGLGTYLTRNMPASERYRSDATPQVALSPLTFDGGGAGLALGGAF